MGKQGKELYEFGPFRVDPKECQVSRDGQPLSLTPKAFETLLVLIENQGHLLLKDELMKAVWPDSFVEEVNLSQNISTLRKALGDSAQGSRYIVTVPGKGYRFVGEVKTILPDDREDVIVESHSRSRLVIEEKSLDSEVESDPRVLTIDGRVLKALPGEVAAIHRRWRWILVCSIAGIILCAFALWTIFSPAPVPRVLRSTRLTHTGKVSPYSRVFTDGSRLYFTQSIGGTWSMAQIPVTGGEPIAIATSLPSIELEELDSHGSRLLASTHIPQKNEQLWLIPTTGGSAQPVGDILASDATWSADGRNIFFSHNGSLFEVGADGAQPRKLLSVRGTIELPRQSPDGTRLRFTVSDAVHGGRSLWEAASDGSNPHPVSLGWKTSPPQWGDGEYTGDWTPDGKQFVFKSQRDGIQSLWVIRESPGWLQRAANHPIQIYSSPDVVGEPRFSVDGKKIFFVGHREQRELVRYDADRKLFVPFLGGIPARHLSFSPDGQWVAYHNTLDGTLWRSRVDGREQAQLTFLPLFAMHSSWSPDSKTIVFQGSLPGEAARLYTVPVAGGMPTVLRQEAGVSLAQPSWCGDGSAVLFMHWPSSSAPTQGSGIGRLDLSTHQTSLIPGSEGFDGVHCSPDGKSIAASDEVNHALMLFDFSRQQWSKLSDGAAYGWGIRWSSDSKYVYYQHIGEEEQPIFRVRISDRKIEQITTSRQILRADVISYTLTGLTHDNSPVASLVRSNSDIYALDLDLP